MFKMILFIISVFSLSVYSNYQILPYGGGESVSKAFEKTILLKPPSDNVPPSVRLDVTHSCVSYNVRNTRSVGADIARKPIKMIITAKSGSNKKSICLKYTFDSTGYSHTGNYSGSKSFEVKKSNGISSCSDFSSGDQFTLNSKNGSYYAGKTVNHGYHYNDAELKNTLSLNFNYTSFSNILTQQNSSLLVKTYYTDNNGVDQNIPVSVSRRGGIRRALHSSASLDLQTTISNYRCGSYASPLMLFFSDKRPSFLNISNFPLFRNSKTAWVEKDHVGYFLAIDLDKDGKISEKDELFGNDLKYLNGFESLKRFDSNRDGLISKKDERFKDLLLWSDKNADGVGLKKELLPLHKKVKEISLNYTGENTVQTENALASGRSHFITKKGKKAEIIDYWFKPAK